MGLYPLYYNKDNTEEIYLVMYQLLNRIQNPHNILSYHNNKDENIAACHFCVNI